VMFGERFRTSRDGCRGNDRSPTERKAFAYTAPISRVFFHQCCLFDYTGHWEKRHDTFRDLLKRDGVVSLQPTESAVRRRITSGFAIRGKVRIHGP
jgi:hypothetical protein